ncbi:unnamed protein product, partial [Heterotrigona itama]
YGAPKILAKNSGKQNNNRVANPREDFAARFTSGRDFERNEDKPGASWRAYRITESPSFRHQGHTYYHYHVRQDRHVLVFRREESSRNVLNLPRVTMISQFAQNRLTDG